MSLTKKIVRWALSLIAAAIGALVIWCLIPIRPTIETLPERPGTKYWQMDKGYRIAYMQIRAEPPASRPPIIYVHGGPGGYVDSTEINTFGALASFGHDVYLYDQVGSGLSDRLPRPKDYTFDGHLADLDEIVTRKIGAERVILIGQSYGGILAAHYVTRHPERVERVVLSSPGELAPTRFTAAGRWVNDSLYPTPDSLHFITVRSPGGDVAMRMPLRGLLAMALATTLNIKFVPDAEADGILNTLVAGFSWEMVCDSANVRPEEGGAGFYSHGWSNWFGDLEDPREAMRVIEVPVLVIQGQCDHIPYAAVYEYVDLFPNSRYVFIEGAGHVIWWEKREEYLRLIGEFLTER